MESISCGAIIVAPVQFPGGGTTSKSFLSGSGKNGKSQ